MRSASAYRPGFVVRRGPRTMSVVLCACVGHLVTSASARAAQVGEEDFAYGMDVDTVDPGGGAVQTLTLPVEVYRGVVRSDLGDVRVFNASGEQVPHALRALSRPTRAVPESARVPVFPLRSAPATPLDDIKLEVRRSDAGTLVQVSTGTGTGTAVDAAGVTLRAYLLDVSAIGKPMQSLNLGWTAAGADFLARVTVEASDDLSSWREVAGGAAVVRLDYRGHILERRAVPLYGVQAPYLRLRWDTSEPPFELTGAEVEPLASLGEPERQHLTLSGEAGEPGIFRFDLGGPIPVDRIDVQLPEPNTLVVAELSSSASPDGPWSERFAGELYRVTYEGDELTSPSLRSSPNADRYWRLQVGEKGGGIGQGVPALAVAWLPQQLLFVARGKGPYILAYGSYAAEATSFEPQSLLDLVPGEAPGELEQASVTLGAEREIAGPVVRQPPPPPTPWKIWILWGLLIAGVGLLGLMTVRLVRQLNATAGESSGDS